MIAIHQGANLRLKGSDLASAEGQNWLNDEVVNFYTALLQDHNRKQRAQLQDKQRAQRVLCMNSFFYDKLVELQRVGEMEKLQGWTNKSQLKAKLGCDLESIFDLDLFIFPINLRNIHWSCGCIDFKNSLIMYFDSIPTFGYMHTFFNTMHSWLVTLRRRRKWNFVKGVSGEQSNKNDCGVFALWNMRRVVAGGSQFLIANEFRKQIQNEIMRGEIVARSWRWMRRQHGEYDIATTLLPRSATVVNNGLVTRNTLSISSTAPQPMPLLRNWAQPVFRLTLVVKNYRMEHVQLHCVLPTTFKDACCFRNNENLFISLCLKSHDVGECVVFVVELRSINNVQLQSISGNNCSVQIELCRHCQIFRHDGSTFHELSAFRTVKSENNCEYFSLLTPVDDVLQSGEHALISSVLFSNVIRVWFAADAKVVANMFPARCKEVQALPKISFIDFNTLSADLMNTVKWLCTRSDTACLIVPVVSKLLDFKRSRLFCEDLGDLAEVLETLLSEYTPAVLREVIPLEV